MDTSVFDDEERFLRTLDEACRRAAEAAPDGTREPAIFVATDSAHMSRLLSRLPGAVTRRAVFPPAGAGRHFSAYKELGYHDRAAQADIVVDMLLLARCHALVHHRRSKFGSYALVSTRDFGGNVQAIERLF